SVKDSAAKSLWILPQVVASTASTFGPQTNEVVTGVTGLAEARALSCLMVFLPGSTTPSTTCSTPLAFQKFWKSKMASTISFGQVPVGPINGRTCQVDCLPP